MKKYNMIHNTFVTYNGYSLLQLSSKGLHLIPLKVLSFVANVAYICGKCSHMLLFNFGVSKELLQIESNSLSMWSKYPNSICEKNQTP